MSLTPTPSLLLSRNQEPKEIQVRLAQQIAAIYIASLSADVPRWFADGMGHWAAAKVYSREDEVKEWNTKAEEFSQSMQQPDDFIKGRLSDHQTALVGYLFVQQLRGNSGRFKKLLTTLQSGSTFEKSFEEAFGQSVETMLGGSNARNRPPRNRNRSGN